MCKSLDDSILEPDQAPDQDSPFAYCCDVYDNEDTSWASFLESLTL